MLNWIIWNRTDYLITYKGWYAIKSNQPTNHLLSSQLNGFNHWYLSLIILFNIHHSFANNEVVTGIPILTLIIPGNPIHSFEQLNGSRYFYVIPLIQYRHLVKVFQDAVSFMLLLSAIYH